MASLVSALLGVIGGLIGISQSVSIIEVRDEVLMRWVDGEDILGPAYNLLVLFVGWILISGYLALGNPTHRRSRFLGWIQLAAAIAPFLVISPWTTVREYSRYLFLGPHMIRVLQACLLYFLAALITLISTCSKARSRDTSVPSRPPFPPAGKGSS